MTPAQRKMLEAVGSGALIRTGAEEAAVRAALALIDAQAADLALHDALYRDARLDLAGVVREAVLDERRACLALLDAGRKRLRAIAQASDPDLPGAQERADRAAYGAGVLAMLMQRITERGPAPDPLPAERQRADNERLRAALAGLDAALDFSAAAFGPGIGRWDEAAVQRLNGAIALARAALREVTP